MNLFDGIINRKPVFANKDFRNTTDAFGSASNFFGTPQTNASINKQYAPSIAPIVQKAKPIPVKATPTTTDSWIYKTLSPFEQTAQMATESMQDTTKMYQQKAQDISQWGQDIAKKPGFEKLGQMVKVKFPEYNDLSDAELGVKWLKKFPEYADIVEGEAQTKLGQGAKFLGGVGSMAVSAPGMVTGGTEQLGTGLGTIASAQSGQDVAEGVLQAGKGAVTAGFGVATGVMPIASTLFGGATGFDTVQKGLGYVGQKAGDLSAGTAGLLGGNQQVQEQARGFGEVALPAVVLGGLSKSGKVIKPVARATGKAIVRGAEMVAPKVAQGVKQLSKTPKVLGKLATTGTEYSTSLATGLSREAQKTIKQSPELYKQARLGGITAQGELGNFIKATEARLTDLSELGKGYESIKKGNKVANIDDITTAYVKATEGVRDRTLTKADKLVIKDANDYMSQMKGQLDETDILSLRRQLDSIMYDPNTGLKRKVSPTGERIVNSMRSEIDKIAKERIAGLKELDAQYAPEVGLLKDVKKQIYDANGNIKPTALSTISNIVGKNKDFKLEQFQKIYPELGARIKALKAFEEVSAIGEMKTGSIARQLGGAALGSTVAPVIGTIAGWVATNPYVVARLLETYGLAKARISEILKKGAKITPEDAKIVQKAVVATPKAKMEDIINNLSFDPKKEALTSKNLTPKVKKDPTKTTVNLSQSKGGFIRLPGFTSKLNTKPQPKRLFAGENSAQPPKGKTGWFKGADGKMRFEIDDSVAQVMKSEIKQSEMPAYSQYKTKLKDVLLHSELFKQYPELKEMDVYFDGDLPNNGFYSDGRGLGKKGITLKADFVQGKEIPGSKGWKHEEGTYKLHSEAKSTILHELQHAIQEKEGFAKGGNLSTVSGLGKSEQDQIARVEKEIRDAITKKNSGDWVFESSTLDEIINSGNAPSEIKQWAKSVAKSGEKGINEFLDSTPFAQYQKLAGEVEARNVQSRMGLTAKERTIKKPESTEDVPRAKQIIRMDSKGPSLSVNKPIVKKAPDVAGLKKIDENSFINEKPIQVYRGEGKGVGNTTYVKGRYFADSKEFASTFGDVKTDTIPANSKIFDFDTIKNNVDQKVIPKDIYMNPDKLTNYLINKGYNVTKNTNSRGVEYVMLNKELNELINIADKYTSYNDFVKGIADDNRFWDIAKNEIKRTNASRDDYSARDFAGEIWNKKQSINPIKEKVNPPIITTVKKIGPDLYGVFDENGKKLTTSWNRNGAKDYQKMYLEGKYKSTPVKNPLVEEARRYGSAEEFIKAQGEPVYHGTYAYKTSDMQKVKSIVEKIYKNNGGKYEQSDLNKIGIDAEYILKNKDKIKIKDESLIQELQDELSSKIKKPSTNFAGKSTKDVSDNSLGIYTTPDKDFATRFTYDIDVNPYSGKKTIIQPRQGYVIDMYYKGNTLDLTKWASKHIDLLSEITGKDKSFISDKLKTKEGTKAIQKLLSNKRDILKEKGFNAVKNYAWDDTVKKYKEELAILDDNSIKTKEELTSIWKKSQ